MCVIKLYFEFFFIFYLWLVFCDVVLEVFCVGLVRVQFGEQVYEVEEVVLLVLSGLFGVGCGDVVEECLVGVIEGFDIGRVVIGDGGGWCCGCWGCGSWVCDIFDEV